MASIVRRLQRSVGFEKAAIRERLHKGGKIDLISVVCGLEVGKREKEHLQEGAALVCCAPPRLRDQVRRNDKDEGGSRSDERPPGPHLSSHGLKRGCSLQTCIRACARSALQKWLLTANHGLNALTRD